MNNFGYGGLNSCTSVPDNEYYLSNTHYASKMEPANGSTIGLMMMLSTLQYQAPSTNPAYANAFNQAGRAAYITSGGQDLQNKVTAKAETVGRSTFHSIGVTDTELGVPLGIAKAVKDRQLKVRGPSIYSIRTDLTFTPNSGILGIKYEW